MVAWVHDPLKPGLPVQAGQHPCQDAVGTVPSILVDQVVEGDSSDLVLASLDPLLFVGVDNASQRPLLFLGEAVGRRLLADRADGPSDKLQRVVRNSILPRGVGSGVTVA